MKQRTPRGGTRGNVAAVVSALLGTMVAACGGEQASPIPPEIRAFAAAKEEHARDLAQKLKLEVSPDLWAFFKAAKAGDWTKADRLWQDLRLRSGQYERPKGGPEPKLDPKVRTPVWQTALETDLALEAFAKGEPKYAFAFGRGIIASIPAGSIYFGGTDPGRGLVTALCKSHALADPFFTLTQNALADGTYLEYLRATYGDRIYIPSGEDSQRAFSDYLANAQRRLEHDRKFPNEPKQIKPGEDVRIVDNRVQVSGQVAVMAINGLLTQRIFDQNPDREFYVEESFPLDWMYPHLSPHGLILKVNREPLETLPEEVVKRDQQFWADQLRQTLGDWLREDTPVQAVCDFAERAFAKKDVAGFTGDPKFIASEYASKTWSKLRSAIAGVYFWRITQARAAAEKDRMRRAADLAFRQSFALCPTSPEAVFRYVNLLVTAGRVDDALRVAGTAEKLATEKAPFGNLAKELERLKAQPAPQGQPGINPPPPKPPKVS